MPRADAAPGMQEHDPTDGRDRLEVIRFRSPDARRQAIGALLDYGMLNLTSYSEEEWLVRTPVARKLRRRPGVRRVTLRLKMSSTCSGRPRSRFSRITCSKNKRPWAGRSST